MFLLENGNLTVSKSFPSIIWFWLNPVMSFILKTKTIINALFPSRNNSSYSLEIHKKYIMSILTHHHAIVIFLIWYSQFFREMWTEIKSCS